MSGSLVMVESDHDICTIGKTETRPETGIRKMQPSGTHNPDDSAFRFGMQVACRKTEIT
jgi:hypothetical protein